MPFSLKKKAEQDPEGFYRVCASADLGHEQMRTAKIAGDTVIVTRVENELRAFSATCPHASGDLSKSAIYRGRIDCPEHGYRFDIRSGRVIWPPDEVCRLKQYEILERDGQVKVRPVKPAGS